MSVPAAAAADVDDWCWRWYIWLRQRIQIFENIMQGPPFQFRFTFALLFQELLLLLAVSAATAAAAWGWGGHCTPCLFGGGGSVGGGRGR